MPESERTKDSESCMIIGVAGGTGSGKSTFTDKIKDRFGSDVSVLYHDNYYRSHHNMPFEQRENVNYDHPDSLETELLVKHLSMLKMGHDVFCPVYDFSVHDRTERTERIRAKKIVIVEGILVLSDPRIRDMCDMKIYVDADADERILRRVTRDVNERGRSVESIVKQYLTTVKPMHNMFVEPSKMFADIVINSGMNPVAFDIVCSKIESVLGTP
ncbi:MAG: uridine kinase [Sphaerochaetaceae bacterium]|nr:uridine kinase [Sphaerochaetaceae bacterium]